MLQTQRNFEHGTPLELLQYGQCLQMYSQPFMKGGQWEKQDLLRLREKMRKEILYRRLGKNPGLARVAKKYGFSTSWPLFDNEYDMIKLFE